MERNEEFEWVAVIDFSNTSLDFLLYFLLALLSVAISLQDSVSKDVQLKELTQRILVPSKSKKLVLISPQNRLVMFNIGIRHDMVQIDNRVFRAIANHNEETSLLFLHAIANQRLDARIPTNLG